MADSPAKLDSNEPVELCRQDWLFGLLLVIVTVFIYLPAWNGTPIWDDDAHLTKPELRSLEGLGRIWTNLNFSQVFKLVRTKYVITYTEDVML